jgi:septal ring factor EnvC (AmiA/AmiB activator)
VFPILRDHIKTALVKSEAELKAVKMDAEAAKQSMQELQARLSAVQAEAQVLRNVVEQKEKELRKVSARVREMGSTLEGAARQREALLEERRVRLPPTVCNNLTL